VGKKHRDVEEVFPAGARRQENVTDILKNAAALSHYVVGDNSAAGIQSYSWYLLDAFLSGPYTGEI
jgi:hypothetical protein